MASALARDCLKGRRNVRLRAILRPSDARTIVDDTAVQVLVSAVHRHSSWVATILWVCIKYVDVLVIQI